MNQRIPRIFHVLNLSNNGDPDSPAEITAGWLAARHSFADTHSFAVRQKNEPNGKPSTIPAQQAFVEVLPKPGASCDHPGYTGHLAGSTPHQADPNPRTADPMLRLLSLILIGGLILPGAAAADPIISEFMASNRTSATDEDGDRPDWIEIRNPGPAAVNLTGWFLTDTAANTSKWAFPALTVPANGHLIVWA